MDPVRFITRDQAILLRPGTQVSNATLNNLLSAPGLESIATPITFQHLPDRDLAKIVGRQETCDAIRTLCSHYNTHCVDVTNEKGFPWRRWLTHLFGVERILGAGIVQVHAVSSSGKDDSDWEWEYSDFIALHRANQSYCIVNPRRQMYQYSETTSYSQIYQLERLENPFHNAVIAEQNWIRLRKN